MTRRERLMENYEDALFALMMDEVAYREGQRLLEENKRLNQSPETQIPADMDKRCLKAIRQTFARQRRRAVGHTAFGAFRNVAAFALAAFIMYGTAYAAVPEVRIKTLNFLIETSDVATRLALDDGTGSWTGTSEKGFTDSAEGILRGYQLPKLPDGFVMVNEGNSPKSAWIRFTNPEGAVIYVSIADAAGMSRYVDTEDAESIEETQIHGYEGLLAEKGNRVSITWGDTDHNNFVSITCQGLEKGQVVEFAEGIEFVAQ